MWSHRASLSVQGEPAPLTCGSLYNLTASVLCSFESAVIYQLLSKIHTCFRLSYGASQLGQGMSQNHLQGVGFKMLISAHSVDAFPWHFEFVQKKNFFFFISMLFSYAFEEGFHYSFFYKTRHSIGGLKFQGVSPRSPCPGHGRSMAAHMS